MNLITDDEPTYPPGPRTRIATQYLKHVVRKHGVLFEDCRDTDCAAMVALERQLDEASADIVSASLTTRKEKKMRLVKKITAEDEQFRIENVSELRVIKRDPIEPEPVGTFVIMAFRITGYDKDFDGSLMARLANVQFDNPKEETGLEVKHIGLYQESELIVTEQELRQMYSSAFWSNILPLDKTGGNVL